MKRVQTETTYRNIPVENHDHITLRKRKEQPILLDTYDEEDIELVRFAFRFDFLR